MKRIYLTSILVLLIAMLGSAQSLSLSLANGTSIANGDTITMTSVDPNASFIAIVWVTNNALTTKYIKAKKTRVSVINGTIDYFCWGNCYDTAVYVSLDSLELVSKQTEEGFSGDYEAHNNVGKSLILYTFFDASDPTDSIAVYVEYFAGSGVGISPILSEIEISNAYPNPAKNAFYLDYDIGNAQTARIEIMNVVGSIVLKQEINAKSGKAKIDISNLKNGIYFYNIIVDGRKVSTKKLIVQN